MAALLTGAGGALGIAIALVLMYRQKAITARETAKRELADAAAEDLRSEIEALHAHAEEMSRRNEDLATACTEAAERQEAVIRALRDDKRRMFESLAKCDTLESLRERWNESEG